MGLKEGFGTPLNFPMVGDCSREVLENLVFVFLEFEW